MSEKRDHIRFNVLLDAFFRTRDSLKKLKVNNLSKEGLGIIADDPIQQGEDVEVELMIPGDNVPVLVRGEVAWASSGEGADGHKGGIKVKHIESHDKGRILDFMYNKLLKPIKKELNKL